MTQSSRETPLQEPDPLPMWMLTGLALAVGVVGGFGAVAFRHLIALFHNALFLGQYSWTYNAVQHTPVGPWGAWVILVPVIGALGVAFLVSNWAPEAKGHGVPEVMDAIYYGQGRIRPAVAVVKSIASALSIGSGGSVGREGPIIQIGSAFGSTLGQFIRMSVQDRVTLIATGAAAGISATFNTPIGGVAFAVELLLPVANARTLLPVAAATVTATCIGRSFLSLDPAFDIPDLSVPATHVVNPWAYLFIALFGALIGALSALFIRSIYWSEDLFDRLPGNYYTRHGLGMLAMGLLMFSLLVTTGQYHVQGVGYATINEVLTGQLTAPALLLILLAAKLLATNLTLGSGASGGVFSPSLYLGATLGGCVGLLIERWFPLLEHAPATFAVVGMAGMIAGTTGAVLTAIIMLFEMTRDYNAVLPLILTVAVAYSVRKWLCYPSIYTLKLLRRGHAVPEGVQAALDANRWALHVMSRGFTVVPSANGEPTSAATRAAAGAASGAGDQIRFEYGGACVCVSAAELGLPPQTGAAGADELTCFAVVGERDSLYRVLMALEASHARTALVSRDPASGDVAQVIGVISEPQILAALRESARLFG